jgi:hypothetical protein
VIRITPLGRDTDTAFSWESSESRVSFWQGIADGIGDRNVRRSGLSEQSRAAEALGPVIM